MEKDKNNENYVLNVLNDIMTFMQKGLWLIFKDPNDIYTSLYDLFN